MRESRSRRPHVRSIAEWKKEPPPTNVSHRISPMKRPFPSDARPGGRTCQDKAVHMHNGRLSEPPRARRATLGERNVRRHGAERPSATTVQPPLPAPEQIKIRHSPA